jgi:hypothetical protein
VITASPYTSLLPGLKTTLTAVVTPPGSYAYQWFKNGVAIPSATTPSIADIDLDDRGAYSVRVTNTTGLPCANTSSDLVIKDSVSNKLFIYPSPNTGQFRVTWYSASATTFTLNLYDSKGAKVYSSKHSVTGAYQPINMDMRVSGKGVYRVVLFDKTGNKLADGSVVVQ